MFNILKTNLKHFFITFTTLFLMLALFDIYHSAESHLREDRITFKLDKATYPLDTEGGFKTFRYFLIANGVIDESLSWQFGKGHLVFVSDLDGRINSVTQALRFIYKMEQDAKNHGENSFLGRWLTSKNSVKRLMADYFFMVPFIPKLVNLIMH